MPDATPEPRNDTPSEHLEDQLEEGLEDSFPASDPPSAARRHRRPAAEPLEPSDED